jgi:hypothetical protein
MKSLAENRGGELVGGAESGSIREERNMPSIIRPRIGSTPLSTGMISHSNNRHISFTVGEIHVDIYTISCSLINVYKGSKAWLIIFQ